MDTQTGPDEGASETVPVSLAALNWARVLQFVQRHGLTGLICLALAYQLGWIARSQATMCGI
jgi:UDP-N-acetylenolpyruvoylglucosamine reductase